MTNKYSTRLQAKIQLLAADIAALCKEEIRFRGENLKAEFYQLFIGKLARFLYFLTVFKIIAVVFKSLYSDKLGKSVYVIRVSLVFDLFEVCYDLLIRYCKSESGTCKTARF